MADDNGVVIVAMVAMLLFFGGMYLGQAAVNQESFDEGFDAGIEYQTHYTMGVIDKNVGINNVELLEESNQEAYVNGLKEFDKTENSYIVDYLNVTEI